LVIFSGAEIACVHSYRATGFYVQHFSHLMLIGEANIRMPTLQQFILSQLSNRL
jgi:hypothetical protein